MLGVCTQTPVAADYSRKAVSHLCNGEHWLVAAGGLFDPCLAARLSTLTDHSVECLDYHRFGSFPVQLEIKKSKYNTLL
jgi:hypothetical protein